MLVCGEKYLKINKIQKRRAKINQTNSTAKAAKI